MIFVFVSVGALDKMHAKHVLPGFTDRTGEEREIESVTTDITKVRTASGPHAAPFRQRLITRIAVVANASSASGSSHPGAPSRNEAQTAKNVQRGLAAKVQELSATFRKKQRVYMERTYS
jgi:syntaxin 16